MAAETMEERLSSQTCFLWLVSYTTQAHVPRVGAALSGPGPFTLVSDQESVSQV